MPTVCMTIRPCFVCGTKEHCPDIGAPGQYHGPRDLDTRPSVSQRSSIYMWVQRCGNCGYCAPDIARGDEQVKGVVESEAYRRQLVDTELTETAASFLCRAIILDKENDMPGAGWACVYAAWVCDDSGFRPGAVKCRLKAIEFFLRAREQKVSFAPSHGEEALLLIDLMRRTEQFDEAMRLADIESSADADERVQTILTYEIDLIEDRDAALHTEAEAFEE